MGDCLVGRSHYITFAVFALAGVMSRDDGFWGGSRVRGIVSSPTIQLLTVLYRGI